MNTLKNQQSPPGYDDTLKTTALFYLQEALAVEAYEKCKDLIQQAKGFGATQSEISDIIADHVKILASARTMKSRLNNRKEFQ